MNEYNYVRALLYAYPRAEMLAEAVREGARVRAGLSYRSPRDTLSLMESIAADMEYAERLLFWKAQLERALSYCDERERFLLEYKYFRRTGGQGGGSGGQPFGCSERSYFRKQNALLKKIALNLCCRGCSKETFYADFEGFSPLMRILSALESGMERRLTDRRRERGVYFSGRQNSPSEGAGDLLPRRTKKAMAATAAPPRTSAAICQPESAAEGAGSEAGGSSGAGPAVSVR